MQVSGFMVVGFPEVFQTSTQAFGSSGSGFRPKPCEPATKRDPLNEYKLLGFLTEDLGMAEI